MVVMGRGIAPEPFFSKVESGLPRKNAQNSRFGAYSGRKNGIRFRKIRVGAAAATHCGIAAAFEVGFLTPS
jgi:hypothetical protein